jgi:hypothetical protein
MDLPDHPRVREIEAERRLRPIGMNCAVNVLRNGSRHVIAFPNTDPNGPGTRQDNPYFGEHPFRVTRTDGQPDVVSMELLPLDKDITDIVPPGDLNYYCFSMAGVWSTVGTSAWSDGTYHPMLGQQIGASDAWDPSGNYAVARDYGPSTTLEFGGGGPNTASEDSIEAGFPPYDTGNTVSTLETLYLGKWLISYADTAPAGYAPMEPAAPDGPWYKSQAGTFTVKFDVYQRVIVTRGLEQVSNTKTNLSTQTIAGLAVSGSESADDYESWASVACNIDFTANKTYPFGTDGDNWQNFDETVIYINNLRILRTA